MLAIYCIEFDYPIISYFFRMNAGYLAVIFLSMTNKIPTTRTIVIALDKNGNPIKSDVAPETNDPAMTPREKNA